jgi:hypothetical protein
LSVPDTFYIIWIKSFAFRNKNNCKKFTHIQHDMLIFLCSYELFSLYRILTMVYNTQNYWGFGLYPSSGF